MQELRSDSLYLLRIQKGYYSEVPQYFALMAEFGSRQLFAAWFHRKPLSSQRGTNSWGS